MYFDDLPSAVANARGLADQTDRYSDQRKSAYLVQVGHQIKVLMRKPQPHVNIMMTVEPKPAEKRVVLRQDKRGIAYAW